MELLLWVADREVKSAIVNVADEQIILGDVTFQAVESFSDADLLISETNKVVGFAFTLSGDEPIIAQFGKCRNVSVACNFMEIILVSGVPYKVEVAQLPACTLYKHPGGHAIGIYDPPLERLGVHPVSLLHKS